MTVTQELVIVNLVLQLKSKLQQPQLLQLAQPPEHPQPQFPEEPQLVPPQLPFPLQLPPEHPLFVQPQLVRPACPPMTSSCVKFVAFAVRDAMIGQESSALS